MILNDDGEMGNGIKNFDDAQENGIIPAKKSRCIVIVEELLEDGEEAEQISVENQSTSKYAAATHGGNASNDKTDADDMPKTMDGIQAEAEQRARQIHVRLEQQWISPYDCYLVALKEAEQKVRFNVKYFHTRDSAYKGFHCEIM